MMPHFALVPSKFIKFMNRIPSAALILVLCLATNFTSRASSLLPITTAQHIAIADAIFRGEVLSLQSQRSDVDGHIFTVAAVRVDEVFEGTLPPVVNLVHAGGARRATSETFRRL